MPVQLPTRVQTMPTAPQFGAARQQGLTAQTIVTAFAAKGLNLTPAQAEGIKAKVQDAVDHIHQNPTEAMTLGMKSLGITAALGLNATMVPGLATKMNEALREVAKAIPASEAAPKNLAWSEYFDKTIGLTNNWKFTDLVRQHGFSPVRISWEDIGRYQGSSVGNRISDVGIWVRRSEDDLKSAKLALSVRRDGNFRDKILVVPSEKIKVHTKTKAGRTVEQSLPERLAQLKLDSPDNDGNVIVSQQFAIVPVPSKKMGVAAKPGQPPRAAFAFSIQPYGSKNLVITDVIEGSSTAVVGGREHQLLYANIDGKKAPFTASRAEDRKDLLKMEAELKAQGMDVDVQRYYLIQVPLENDPAIKTSDMGTPPFERPSYSLLGGGALESFGGGPYTMGISKGVTRGITRGGDDLYRGGAANLGKVAIGHGETEGPYNAGSGFQGKRAKEPVRVTVVNFVTPKGEVTEKDMENFSKAFKQWDEQAIWGGSFVVPDAK